MALAGEPEPEHGVLATQTTRERRLTTRHSARASTASPRTLTAGRSGSDLREIPRGGNPGYRMAQGMVPPSVAQARHPGRSPGPRPARTTGGQELRDRPCERAPTSRGPVLTAPTRPRLRARSSAEGRVAARFGLATGLPVSELRACPFFDLTGIPDYFNAPNTFFRILLAAAAGF